MEAGRFRPVYYFFGNEEYRIKEAEKTLTKMFLGSRSPASNHTVLSAAKSKTVDILTELSVIPMMGERQVFTITDVQSLTQGDVEKVIALLDPPDPNRVVILTSPVTKTPRKKTKMYTLLTTKTTSVEFGRLTGNMSERKVRFMLQERHIDIDPDALEILVRMGGGNMGGLIAEVNKLVDYVGEGGRITREEIALVSSDYQAFEVYELAEYIAAREIDRAIAILGSLLRKGERASSLLFWIGEHFIGVYLSKNGKPVRMGNRDMSWKYRKHVNLFTNEQLEQIIELTAQADMDLRSNIKPERVILEKLIIGILADNDRKSSHEQKNRGRTTGFCGIPSGNGSRGPCDYSSRQNRRQESVRATGAEISKTAFPVRVFTAGAQRRHGGRGAGGVGESLSGAGQFRGGQTVLSLAVHDCAKSGVESNQEKRQRTSRIRDRA